MSASGSAGEVFDWYDTESSSVSLSTGSIYSPNVTSSRSFWVEATNSNGCIGDREEVIVTINPIFALPNVDNEVRCGRGPVTLNASVSGSGVVYKWYQVSSDGYVLHTGAEYTTPTLSSSKSYYVEAISAKGCKSAGRTEVLAEIFPIPAKPTVFNDERCRAGVVSLRVSSAPSGGQYNWYNSSSSSTVINTGDTYDVTLSTTTDFYVSVISAEGCEGSRAKVTGTVNDIPEAPTGTDGERCGSGQVSLSASSSSSGTFKWYATDVSETIIATGSEYTTPVIVQSPIGLN